MPKNNCNNEAMSKEQRRLRREQQRKLSVVKLDLSMCFTQCGLKSKVRQQYLY